MNKKREEESPASAGLREFSSTQLLQAQKHLRLGNKHMLTILSQKELHDFYSLAGSSRHLDPDKQPKQLEWSSPVLLSLNTILTSYLGGWMGASSFMGLERNAPALLWPILAAAILIGGSIAYLNYTFLNKSIKNAFERRNAQRLEIYLLNRAIENTKEEIEYYKQILLKKLHSMGVKITKEHLSHLLENERKFFKWFSEIQKKPIDRHFGFYTKENPLTPAMEKIWHARVPFFKTSQARPSFRGLLVQLIPTMFGLFSSLFVYLNGFPDIAKEMGKTNVSFFFTSPKMKAVQFTIAILIVAYFYI
jgi:hypothetical protein